MNENDTSGGAIVRFILQSLKPFKWWIVVQVAVSVVWAMDQALRPYLLKIMLDRMSCLNRSEVYSVLVIPAIFFISLALMNVLLLRFYDYAWLKISSPLKRDIGLNLMQRMMRHSYFLYQNHLAGNLGNKINDVISGIPDILKKIIDQFFSNFLLLGIATVTVSSISFKFSVVLLIWVTVFVLMSVKLSHKAFSLSVASAETRSSVIGFIIDILNNIMSVRFFSGEKKENEKFAGLLDSYVKVSQNRAWFLIKLYAFQGISFVVYQGVCLFLLIEGFKNGEITPGDFVFILTINFTLLDSLWLLSEDIGYFTEHSGNVIQGLSIALSPIEIRDKPGAKELVVTKGEIVFDKVHFCYKGAEPLFQDKSITIYPGQKVGLVGYSGGGKTTFVNLVLRLFDVTAGRILIDGQDIRDVTQDSLNKAIGIIPQSTSLFHRTIKENICCAKIDATEQEIIEAAKKAHAHEFIKEIPGGYYSMAGERGAKISGGQHQRIAIARVFLKDPPIIILDEATSQLDPLIEGRVQNSLTELMKNKTTIVIAHRLATLLHMDRILVFDHGKIVENGTHETLLAQGGLYKMLWDAQKRD
ncbi:MAG: ABC transporter ATP-binding protein [bacterium]|nr:ABC transporter ATP-binding protein [bacterium]